MNFDLHGPMEPSSISVVETDTMIEVERIPTGIMPHGSRLSSNGTWLYSVNMMSDEVVEVDALAFSSASQDWLSRLAAMWKARKMRKAPAGSAHLGNTSHGRMARSTSTGNNVARIFEIDVASWEVVRTFETGPGPYNLAVTDDGTTLVATYKTGAAVGFWDLSAGRERARTETSRTIPHGVALTPDGEYAFVTLEGVGDEPGTVEVYQVDSGERVGAVDVGKQAGGIAFWKIES